LGLDSHELTRITNFPVLQELLSIYKILKIVELKPVKLVHCS